MWIGVAAAQLDHNWLKVLTCISANALKQDLRLLMLLDVDLSGSFHVIHELVFELEGRVVAASFSSSCLSKAQSLQLFRARTTWDKMSKPCVLHFLDTKLLQEYTGTWIVWICLDAWWFFRRRRRLRCFST